MTANIIDLFSFSMAKERIHPAKLTAKQVELRRKYYGERWAKFESDQADLDQMAEWV